MDWYLECVHMCSLIMWISSLKPRIEWLLEWLVVCQCDIIQLTTSRSGKPIYQKVVVIIVIIIIECDWVLIRLIVSSLGSCKGVSS